MRTKRFLITLLLCTALLLAGCGTGTEQNQTTDVTKDETAEHATETAMNDNAAAEAQNRFLGILDQRTARIGDVLYFSEIGVKDLPMILAVDLNTMESFPLCAKPECDHKSGTCDACAGNAGPVSLTVYHDQLFFLDTVFGPVTGVIYRVEADGSRRTEVTRLNRDLENPEEGKSDAWFGIYGGKVYRCFCGNYVEDAEPRQTAVLYAQPLEADSADRAVELLRVEGAAEMTACMDGNMLYCGVSSLREDGSLLFAIYAYDMDAQSLETLCSEPVRYAPKSVACVDDALIFGYSPSAFRFSLRDRKLTELSTDTNREDTTVIGENCVYIQTSPGDCRCVDFSGKTLYEGSSLPPELQDRENLIAPAGYSDGIFYFFIETVTETNSVFNFVAFDTADFAARVLRSVSVDYGWGF